MRPNSEVVEQLNCSSTSVVDKLNRWREFQDDLGGVWLLVALSKAYSENQEQAVQKN